MRINSFSGLRFFLILFVFTSHSFLFNTIECTKKLFTNLSLGGFCVKLFLILSGFCIYLGYNSYFQQLRKDSVICFLKKRFCKLYPAYIFSNVIVFSVELVNGLFHDFSIHCLFNHLYNNLKSYISVLLMVQAWIPPLSTAGNSASWFISTVFFCYLLSPLFLWSYNKIRCKCPLVIIFFLFIVLNYYLPDYLRTNLKKLFGISPDLEARFYYAFPLFNLLEYLQGFVLCDLFLHIQEYIKNRSSVYIFTFFEFASLALFLISPSYYYTSKLLPFFIYSFVILVFAIDEGYISKLFSTKLSVFLGSISLYFYLFHYPIISSPIFYIRKLQLYYISLSDKKALLFATAYYSIGFILSLLTSYLYDKAYKKIEDKIQERKSLKEIKFNQSTAAE